MENIRFYLIECCHKHLLMFNALQNVWKSSNRIQCNLKYITHLLFVSEEKKAWEWNILMRERKMGMNELKYTCIRLFNVLV